ncbi:MAG: hypothetical protein OXS30_01410 [Chloroflexota bacterium]|nr:hypothetical protein [Chloroflexota bacterium]
MNIGGTFFGLDERGHLWIIASQEIDDGNVAVVNFTTHGPGERSHCSNHCLVVAPGEHSYPSHESCIYFRGAQMMDIGLIRERVASGRYEAHDPVSPELLERIQLGALTSDAPEAVKAAIRRDMG